MNDLTIALAEFCRRLASANIPYLVGGSVAAGMWGHPRQTNDVDVEVWIDTDSATRFLAAFEERYVVFKDAFRAAIFGSEPFASFQVLDTELVLKFDCFVQGKSPMDAEAHGLARTLDVGGTAVRFACPEHILIQKLRWYELGHRSSERQWRDIQGIVRVTTDIDWELVERWANTCGVSEVLGLLRGSGNDSEG
jgi:hypothetical protein